MRKPQKWQMDISPSLLGIMHWAATIEINENTKTPKQLTKEIVAAVICKLHTQVSLLLIQKS